MQRLISTVLILTTIACATPAIAQNKAALREAFCAKEPTVAERTICEDRQLTRLDAHMNDVYQGLRKTLKRRDFVRLRRKQRAWLKERNRCSGRHDCLESKYTDRIAILEQALQDAKFPTTRHRVRGEAGRCQQVGSFRSRDSDREATIVFQNKAQSEEDSYKIYWLDFRGRRKLYATVYKGDTHRQLTFLTHPWLITAPQPGGGEICIGIYMPKPGRRVIRLD